MKLSLEILRNTTLNIHIVGATAVEGSAIARLLHSLGASKVTLHDFCPPEEFNKRFLSFHNGVENRATLLRDMQRLPYPIRFQNDYLHGVEQADLLFVPQNWYGYACNFPILEKVIASGKVAISSFIDLSLQLFPGTTIGVTGTHGKTTISRLIAHILQAAGKTVFTAGNDRHSIQFLSQLTESQAIDPESFLVLEISNRQLKLPLEKSPHIAIISNVYPNHLDEHVDLADYRKTKMLIASKQTAKDLLIVGDNDKDLTLWAKERSSTLVGSELTDAFSGAFQMPATLLGEHNRVNATIVYYALRSCDLSDEIIAAGLATFPGVEKRQQMVFENTKVRVINNSIATTPTATTAAVNTFSTGPLFVILGGDDKNIPAATWNTLKTTLLQRQSAVALLPGTISQKIDEETWLHPNNLEDALAMAQEFASKQRSLTTILISPSGEAFYTKYLVGKSLSKLAQDYFSSSTTLKRG